MYLNVRTSALIRIERQLSITYHFLGRSDVSWISMQRMWTNRNVDLKLFEEQIREFFEAKQFDVTSNEAENTYHLTAGGSPEYKMDGQVKVTLTGAPQDFSITLELERKSRARKYSIPMTLAASLGLGLLLRDEFKSDEAFLNLKRDLWAFADRAAINLTGSASRP